MKFRMLFVALILLSPTLVTAQAPSAADRLARDILEQLVNINTTDSVGNTTTAAEAMAARLRAAGFPDADVQVLGPNPRKGNLVARYRGTGARRPILLLAHIDVVEAKKEDWSADLDPFAFVERDGYFYGRGSSDDKAMAAIWIANLILMKQDDYRPDRDVIVALTADEEGGTANGVSWLLANHRDLIDADFCLNEGGGGQIVGGRYILNEVQASEKVYQSYQLEVTNPGGHSSLPLRDNAIYHLAKGLARLADFDFPVRLNPITHAFFERTADIEQGQTAADMKAVTKNPPDVAAVARLAESSAYYNAQMRTTCVATMLDGGHAQNALPQLARAVVNCRMLPGSDPKEVEQALVQVLADDQIAVTPMGPANPSDPSPLRPDVMGPIERITREMWGVPVVPVMLTGATDGLYLRNAGIPTYGVSGIFEDINDVRAHGRDERVGVKPYYEGREFLDRLVRALTSAAPARP